jgi:hypothetical protein
MVAVAAPPHAATIMVLSQALRFINYFILQCQG